MKEIRLMIFVLVLGVSASFLHAGNWAQSLFIENKIYKGNSDTEQLNISYKNERKSDKTKFNSSLTANFGQDDGEQNIENYNADLQYNQYFTKRTYWLINSKYEIDNIADLERRAATGLGSGFSFIKNAKMNLDIDNGFAYLNTKYLNQDHKENLNYRASEKYVWKINEKSKFWQNAEYWTNIADTTEYLFNVEIGIEVKIAGNFSLKTFVINKYNNEPMQDKKRNDLQYMTAFGWSIR